MGSRKSQLLAGPSVTANGIVARLTGIVKGESYLNSHPAGQRLLLPKYQRSRRSFEDSCLCVAVYSVGRLARLASSPSYATGPYFSGNGARVARDSHKVSIVGFDSRSRY